MADIHHVVEQRGGWAVRREGASRASSVHRTKAEAVAAAKQIAKRRTGAEVIVHPRDGRFRDSNTYAADLRPAVAARAPRSDGSRTTLRVPDTLTTTADRLASDLSISRNDALLRLATRGAQLYELEQRIADRRAERWAAVFPGDVETPASAMPSPDEVAQLLASLDETPDDPR